jgi:hypothetical protein
MAYFLYKAVPVVFCTLLFGVPLAYSLWSRNPKRIFWFTWILWTVVFLAMHLLTPVWIPIVTEVEGAPPDGGMSCGLFAGGALMGWFPGVVFGAVGWAFGWVYRKCSSVVKDNEVDI